MSQELHSILVIIMQYYIVADRMRQIQMKICIEESRFKQWRIIRGDGFRLSLMLLVLLL